MLEECILSLRLDLIMLKAKVLQAGYAYSLWKCIKFSRNSCKNISANKQTGTEWKLWIFLLVEMEWNWVEKGKFFFLY